MLAVELLDDLAALAEVHVGVEQGVLRTAAAHREHGQHREHAGRDRRHGTEACRAEGAQPVEQPAHAVAALICILRGYARPMRGPILSRCGVLPRRGFWVRAG